MICPYFSDPTLLFFTEDVPSLIYYSHFSSIVVSLIIGLLVFQSDRKSLTNKLLFIVSVLFTTWTVLSLIQWTNNSSGLISFTWSILGIVYSSLCVFTLYFFLVLVNGGKDVSVKTKLVWLISLIPILLLTNTTFNIVSFDLIECGAIENIQFTFYYYFIGLMTFCWVLFSGIRKTYQSSTEKKMFVTITAGTGLFLFAFFINGFIASYLFDKGIVGDYTIEQFGLFGMTAFMAILTYMIVKFKTFNIKLAGAQALVLGLIVLIGSLLFVEKSFIPRVISLVTLLFTIVLGFFLIQSVKKEIKQREELEGLTDRLEAANERLKELDKAKSEFVSIASHQLRSPLTAIRGYASMLAEGSFGQLPVKAAESAKRIEDSAKLMAMSIEDYLNVSRIESGNMKYNLSDFNIVEMTSHLCDDLRPEAMSRNLILLFRSNVTGKGIVNADVGKTNQIIHNLVNNSIKYTPKGSVSVFVRDDIKARRIYIDITDTGIGMSQETISKLFGKFSRANNANSVNTSGTGLGLYVALKMAEAMGGTITCTSEGDGKGSTFTFELPLAM